ncbi:MAG TPA: ABC-2 family transporter protein [Polyangia bacterium]|nr:ABC-2 family transporter protein [Polyangia bacterium]
MTVAAVEPPRGARGLRHVVRAFPTLLRVGFAEIIAYRAEFLVWVLTTNMPLVMLAIWRAVAADGPVGRFDQTQFTAYFLAVLIVRLLTSTWVIWQMSMEIRDGTLAAKLLRPIHPLVAYAAEHLAAVPMRALVVSPIVGVLVWVAHDRLALGDPRLLAIFLLSLLGAWLLIYFTMVVVGALAFFVDSALGVFDLWIAIHAIFSGYLIPLESLPSWIRGAAAVLPFRFMLGFPVEVVVGLLDPAAAARQLAVQWGYVVVLASVALMVWRAGVRRFQAFGG